VCVCWEGGRLCGVVVGERVGGGAVVWLCGMGMVVRGRGVVLCGVVWLCGVGIRGYSGEESWVVMS
jgi:hypothetical protein